MFNWRLAVVGMFLVPAAFVVTEYSYYRFVPLSNWFKYESVTAIYPKAGRDIVFLSKVSIRKPVNIEWNPDVLYCRTPESDGEFTNYSSESDIGNYVSAGDRASYWLYSGDTPNEITNCYLRSVPTAVFPWGIKRQHAPITTDIFTLK